MLSVGFAILTAMNGAAQDQQDPFKKGQQPATANIVKPPAGESVTSQTRKRLLDKLNNIMIEKINFQNANIVDVISYLHQQSLAGDRDSASGDKGVNILLRLSQPGQPATPTATTAGGGTGNVPLITMSMRDISLMDAIKYITEIAGLKYRIEEQGVIIHRPDIFQGEMETRTYKILPSTIEAMAGGAGALAATATATGKSSSADRPDIKKFMNECGIPFPEDTSIVYIPAPPLLIVKNTRENLEIFERLLSKLNIGTLLVSVEMRMIEMPKLAADELFKEQGGLAKTCVINEKTLSAISDIVVKGKAKVVSQSKIMTKSGMNCQNKSVREFIYPTEYAVCEKNATNSVKNLPAGSSNATNGVKALPDMLIPTAFETRDCGTILDVTPTIGPDMQVIDVVVMSQRVRLSAFPNKIIVNSPAGKTEVEQPVFISEDVTTSLTIQNGTTVLVSVCDAISDQEKQEKAGENIILFIMTANIMTVNSMTVNAAMTPP